MLTALAREQHHDPALDTGQLWFAAPALVLLVLVTVWAWRRGRGPGAALALVAVSGLWLLADPVHAPSLWTFQESHAITPGDLLVLPTLAVAVAVLRRGLRSREPARR